LSNNKKIVIALFVLAGLGIAILLAERADETDNHTPATSMEERHDVHEEEGDGHEDEVTVLKLSQKEIQEFGVRIATAGPGKIKNRISLPGEVNINADRLAHIVPQVPGLVRKIYKTLGDRVKAGELMAVLESRELADAKSAYFVAKERLALAEANFKREKGLWKKRISAEREYLEAKQALAEANIELKSAKQKLHALGFTETALKKLSQQPHMKFTRYEIRSPFNGTVIEKHITIGEKLTSNSKAFAVADLSTVWVNLNVYQKDMPFVEVGQKTSISITNNLLSAEGIISYIGPLVGEKTRTATARVVLPNPDGRWKPGLFVNAMVTVSYVNADIVIPGSAIQRIGDKPVVFLLSGKPGEEGFTPRHVSLGRSDEESVEILSSLRPGERYVSEGAFVLKAEMNKGQFGGGHGH